MTNAKIIGISIFMILLFATLVLAANDPGHDVLYIEQTGDSELNGTLNLTQNVSVKGGLTLQGSGLTFYGDGTVPTPSTGGYISGRATSNDLYIDTQNNIYIKNAGGDTVFIGITGTPTNFNISGDAFIQRNLNITTNLNIGGVGFIGGSQICTAGNGLCSAAGGNSNLSANAVTAGYLPQFQTGSMLNNSAIYQLGNDIGIGTQSPSSKVEILTNTDEIVNLTIGTSLGGGSNGGGIRFKGAGGAIINTISGIQGTINFGIFTYANPVMSLTGSTLTLNPSHDTNDYAIVYNKNSNNAARIHHTGAYGTGTLELETYSGSWTETGLTITQNKVGIGTSSPTGTLEVNGTLNVTQNITINGIGFIAGSQICTAGNGLCSAAGGTGNVTSTGSSNYIPAFSSGTTIINSIISQSGTTISVVGNLNVTNKIYSNASYSINNQPSYNFLDDNLIAYFPFNERNNSANAIIYFDRSKNGYIGTCNSATGCNSTNGNLGNALWLNGESTSYIDLGNAINVSVTNNLSETYSFWIKPRNYSGIIFSSGQTAGDSTSKRYIYYSQTGTIRHLPCDVSFVSGLTIVPLNTWTHIAITIDNHTNSIYVNGNLDVTQNISASCGFENSYIGTGYHGSFNGSIDEFRIYSVAFTSAQVKELYLNGINPELKPHISSTGNIGIGTTTPSSQLHVIGNANITGSAWANGSQLCTAGNGLCAAVGGNGNVTSTGSANFIPLFSSGTTIVNSIVSQSGGILTVAGNISVPASFFIGSGAEAKGASHATAIGYSSNASGQYSLAIGGQTLAGGRSGIAIGYLANVGTFLEAIAVGRDATVTSSNGIAIGFSSNASGNAAALGYGAFAIGTSSVAVGDGSEAAGRSGIAIGLDSRTSSSNEALAIGRQAEGLNSNTAAIGYLANASGTSAIAIGSSSISLDTHTTAIGTSVISDGTYSIAIGSSTIANNNNAIAMGRLADASGSASIAIGINSNATTTSGIAIGNSASNTGIGSVAIGSGARAETTQSSVALGANSYAGGTVNQYAIALGATSHANGSHTIAIGPSANANNTYAIATGFQASATGTDSIAIGRATTATRANSIAIGQSSFANNTFAIAMGYQANANGTQSIAIGYRAFVENVTNSASIAIGYGTQALASNGVAIARDANAAGGSAVAIGYSSYAASSQGIALGASATAEGIQAIAIGTSANASSASSLSVGYLAYSLNGASAFGNAASAAGGFSTAIGTGAKAEGGFSTGLGYLANASGTDAIAIGHNNFASGTNSLTIGEESNATANYAISIGYRANTPTVDSIALGRSASTFAANQLMIGDDTVKLNTIIRGQLNVSGAIYELNGSRVCTAANGFCGNISSRGSTGYIPQFQSGTILNNSIIFQNGTNIGIGTTTPNSKLSINGGDILQTQNITYTAIASTELSASVNSIFSDGEYVFLGLANDSGNEFRILDITNRTNLTNINIRAVSGLNLNASVNSVKVSGKYAYLGLSDDGGNQIRIVDISNISTPVVIGGIDLGSIWIQEIYVQGKYLYASSNSNDGFSFKIIDISNPVNPVLMGTKTGYGSAVFVQGKYAFTSSDSPNDLRIYDISNPTRIETMSSTNTPCGSTIQTIAVSGKYAYVGCGSTPTDFNTYDISDVSNPVKIANITVSTSGTIISNIEIQGKYAYLSGYGNPGYELFILDLSYPYNPTIIGGIDLGTHIGAATFTVGKKMILGTSNVSSDAEFKIIELNGIDTPSARIGSLETGTLHVENLGKIKQLLVDDGINIGPGGIYSQGSITATAPATSSSISGFDVVNVTGGNLFRVSSEGKIGINTLNQTASLQINSSNTLGSLWIHNTTGATQLFVNGSSGNVGIGTITPTSPLHVIGNANITGTIYYGGNLTGYGADFAENFEIFEKVNPGDVVCLNNEMKVGKCKTSSQKSVAGVVSTNPTIIGNGGITGAVVGIVGIVPTKVVGPIERFELLTTSNKAGYAQKASAEDFGAIIGKTMESCSQKECLVKVLVSLG